MLPQNRGTAQMFIALWYSLETLTFIFCILRKWPNDKKLLLWSGILSCVKQFFLLWPTSILIRFQVKFHILAILFICVYSSWYSGLFCIFSLFYICFTGFWFFFVFSSRYSRFTPACLGINFLWVRHPPNTEHPICQFCAAFSISLFLFLIFTFYFSQSRPYSILWKHCYPYIWK